MKKDKNRIRAKAGCFFAVTLTFGLFVGSMSPAVSTEASDLGSLTVQLEKLSPPSDWEGVSILISKVGTADVYGEPEFYEEYGIESYPVNSKETEEVIEKLLAAGALADAPLYGTTDAGGAARFAGLSDGIYLGAAQESSHYGEISPFLIHTPYYYGTEDGEDYEPSYDVTVYPKALPITDITPIPIPTEVPEATISPIPTEIPEATVSPIPTEIPEATVSPTPTDIPEAIVSPTPTEIPEATVSPIPTEAPEVTVSLTPTEEPETTVTPTLGETDKPGDGSAGGGNSSAGSSPKTGDDSQVGLLLGLLCASGITIGMVRSRRKKA